MANADIAQGTTTESMDIALTATDTATTVTEATATTPGDTETAATEISATATGTVVTGMVVEETTSTVRRGRTAGGSIVAGETMSLVAVDRDAANAETTTMADGAATESTVKAWEHLSGGHPRQPMQLLFLCEGAKRAAGTCMPPATNNTLPCRRNRQVRVWFYLH